MARTRKSAEPTGIVPFAHLGGLGFALALTGLFLIVVSLLVTATGLTEASARWLMIAGGIISVLFGSSQTGRKMGKAGWLNGGLTGLAYATALLILALLLDMNLTARSLTTLAAGFTLGAAGGVLGVNRR